MTEAAETIIETEETSNLGLFVMIGFLVVVAFVAGTMLGVLVDGTAEVLNDFRRTQPACATPVSVASDDATKPPVSDAPPITPFPENNAVEWAISVAPGTPTAPLEIRNNAMTANILVTFAMPVAGSDPHPTAKLWVRAGELARMTLPTAQYVVSIFPYRTTASYDASATPAKGPVTPLRLTTADASLDPPAIVIDGGGRVRVVEPAVKTERDDEPPKKRKRQARDPEYEGLGRSSRTTLEPPSPTVETPH